MQSFEHGSTAQGRQEYNHREQVTRFFDGTDLIQPGVVPIQQWRPDTDAEAAARAGMWCGVGKKP